MVTSLWGCRIDIWQTSSYVWKFKGTNGIVSEHYYRSHYYVLNFSITQIDYITVSPTVPSWVAILTVIQWKLYYYIGMWKGVDLYL